MRRISAARLALLAAAFSVAAFSVAAFSVAPAAAAAYDANGVALGASEDDIKKRFPSAYCKPLEWASRGAERRCDDAKISFGGAEGRITFYLRKGAVQAFDVRFDTKDLERVTKQLKSRYGEPVSEVKEAVGPEGKVRELYKVLWESGADRAVLTAQMDKKRASLLVSRGNFDEEIYRVR
jgi:hypothetical protein